VADAARVVHCWGKNSAGEEVRALLSTFKGRRYVDLRVYLTSTDGEAHPTRRGSPWPWKQLPELEEAVRRLRAAVAELGDPPAGRADRYASNFTVTAAVGTKYASHALTHASVRPNYGGLSSQPRIHRAHVDGQ
jgi:Transcriptional Coactivator p15 (PC4)